MKLIGHFELNNKTMDKILVFESDRRDGRYLIEKVNDQAYFCKFFSRGYNTRKEAEDYLYKLLGDVPESQVKEIPVGL